VDETVYYQDESVRVTSVRAEFGPNRFAIASISAAVAVKRPSKRLWGALALVVGISGIGLGILVALNESLGYPIVISVIAGGTLLAIAGLALLTRVKDHYIVRLGLASGEVDVLISTNEDRVQHIVRAIGAAISEQG